MPRVIKVILGALVVGTIAVIYWVVSLLSAISRG